jgi:hypothetical protein
MSKTPTNHEDTFLAREGLKRQRAAEKNVRQLREFVTKHLDRATKGLVEDYNLSEEQARGLVLKITHAWWDWFEWTQEANRKL